MATVTGSSGQAPTATAAAPNVKRSAGGASGGRPGFRRGSSAAAASAQRRRGGFPATPEQGGTSSPSSSERGRAVGDGGVGSGAGVGERKVLPGGGVRRGDKKEVARSDRRRARGTLAEAATRITSGDVSYVRVFCW